MSVIEVAALLGLIAVAITAAAWFVRRAAGTEAANAAATASFERLILEEVYPSGIGSEPRSNLSAAAVAPGLVAPGPRRDLSPFAETVASRLEAARILDSVEGPLRVSNPSMEGTVLRLRSGVRLVVLERFREMETAGLEPVMRNYEAVIVPGPGGEPVALKRFQSLIAELMSF